MSLRYQPTCVLLNRSALAPCLLLLAAAVLRVAAAATPLWLDEIWSLRLAQTVSSPIEILTRIREDNNHYLNTLYLYLIGGDHGWTIYRIPSIAAGTLTVALMGWIAGRRGRAEQLTAMVLSATSYLLIHYSSEARGYASVLLFAFAGYECLHRYIERKRAVWALSFSVCCILGFLSHPAFIHFYVAAVYWSLVSFSARQRQDGLKVARRMTACHFLPALFGLLLYVTNIRHLDLGGGPQYTMADMLARAGSLAVGGPLGGPGALLAASLFAAGVIAGLHRLRKGEGEDWKFFAFLVALPVIQVLIVQPPFLFVRYFLLPIAFSMLLLSYALAWLYRTGRLGPAVYGALVLVLVAGNSAYTVRLVREGRGRYLEALEFMARMDAAPVVTISSDHNHGNRMLVEFYASYLRPPRKVVYYDVGRWPTEPPAWLIIHQYRGWTEAPPRDRYVERGHSYQFVRAFDTAILSGWKWLCYRRVS